MSAVLGLGIEYPIRIWVASLYGGTGEGEAIGAATRYVGHFRTPHLNPLPFPKGRGGKHEDVTALQHFNGAWPVVILPCVIDLFFGRLATP